MKKKYFLIFFGLLIGCSGMDSGAGVLKGKIYKPGPNYAVTGEYLPPGVNNKAAYVYIEGATGYTGHPILAPINLEDGTFEVNIDLGISDSGPPVVYVSSASFDLKLQVNGVWWTQDTTSWDAEAFHEGVVVESGKITDIGQRVIDYPGTTYTIWN